MKIRLAQAAAPFIEGPQPLFVGSDPPFSLANMANCRS